MATQDALWHFTPLRNLSSILDSGHLFSYSGLRNAQINPKFVSDESSRVRDLASGRAEYVFLSLLPYSPFYKKVLPGLPHVWLRISADIIFISGAKSKSGRTQYVKTTLNNVPPNIFKLSEAVLNRSKTIVSQSHGGPNFRNLWLFEMSNNDQFSKDILSHEILVPQSISLAKYCEGIYCCAGESVQEIIFHPLRHQAS